MIRRSKFNINYSTDSKKKILDDLFVEYKRVVNIFVVLYHRDQILPKFTSHKCDTWLSARMQQLAGKTALEIIKSGRKREYGQKYKRFKKVYCYFIRRNRQSTFISRRFSELNLKYRNLPVYKQDTITLDTRFIEFTEGLNSFDMWIKIGSIGNKLKLFLPSRKHKHFNGLLNKRFELKKSGQLKKENGHYYFIAFLEKPTPEKRTTGLDLGIDLGINKLMVTSENNKIGVELKPLLNKLKRKKANSKGYKKNIEEIKNYIGHSVNQIDFPKYKTIVIEDLKNISKNTKKDRKCNKPLRKLLSHWNRGYFNLVLSNRCEENSVLLTMVDPSYTSRTCPKCKFQDKENRKLELFKCLQCGFEEDSDYIGSLNILERFCLELIVSDSTQTEQC